MDRPEEPRIKWPRIKWPRHRVATASSSARSKPHGILVRASQLMWPSFFSIATLYLRSVLPSKFELARPFPRQDKCKRGNDSAGESLLT